MPATTDHKQRTTDHEPLTTLAARYALPDELAAFLRSGFLRVLAEHEPHKTLHLHIPALRSTDLEGRITTYEIVWIHPPFNAEFCHYYAERPGDGPNFYVRADTTDVGDELLGLEAADADRLVANVACSMIYTRWP